MAAGFLTSSPISLSPLGLHFSVILSHLFFSSWMMCRSSSYASSRGYQPAAPMACQTSPLQKCSHAARIANALLCPSCQQRAFLQSFSRLPGAVVGLFNMAQEGEWLQNRAENWSQAVISFHRCPPVTFSAEPHPFAFSTSKWGLSAFQGRGFMWPNSSNFVPLQVIYLGCLHTLLWTASGTRASPGCVCWSHSPTVPTHQTEGRHGHLKKLSPT